MDFNTWKTLILALEPKLESYTDSRLNYGTKKYPNFFVKFSKLLLDQFESKSETNAKISFLDEVRRNSLSIVEEYKV